MNSEYARRFGSHATMMILIFESMLNILFGTSGMTMYFGVFSNVICEASVRGISDLQYSMPLAYSSLLSKKCTSYTLGVAISGWCERKSFKAPVPHFFAPMQIACGNLRIFELSVELECSSESALFAIFRVLKS